MLYIARTNEEHETMSYISPIDRNQYTLMNSLDELVPTNHPVRLLDQLVEVIVKNNPEQFGTETSGDVGRPEYSPSTLLKLYLYGYCNGIRSSRKLETETKRNIEVLWLLGTLSPDHKTIADYRKDHGNNVKFITKAFREFLHKEGYIIGKRVAIDGSKFKANAKREMLTMKKIAKRLERLDEQLEKYLQVLATNDYRDDVLDELEENEEMAPREALLVEKVVALQQEIETLKQHQKTLEQSGQKALSTTDPEAPLMKSRDGKHPGYNVQIVVDAQHGLIADSEVLTDENDLHVLPVVMESLKEEIGRTPEESLLDKGYYTPDEIEKVESTTKTQCYIPIPKKPKCDNAITFTYEQPLDAYRCSAGKLLPIVYRNVRKRGSLVDIYRGTECANCPMRQGCTKAKKGRTVARYHNQQWREDYIARVSSRAAQKIMALRKTLAEHPFGFIKCLGGKIPLLLRGVKKVATEINLYTTAFNLKRMSKIELFDILLEKITSYQWKIA